MLGKAFLTRPPIWHAVSPLRSWRIRPRSLDSPRWNHAAPNTTVVEQYLLDRVKLAGPLSFATYMQQCLSHPTHGYYMNPANSVFGARGDFITSPEISQMFGELVAIWLISQYKTTGNDFPVRFIELGPGKGTLMADILRVALKFLPGKPVNIHLVETSASMRANQKDILTFNENPHVNVNWHDSLNEISPSPLEYTMLVAHEFFDALPIHMLQKTETGQWHEVLVASNAIPETRDSRQQTTTAELNSPSSNIAEERSAKKANFDSAETIQYIPATSTESFRYVLAPTSTPVSTVLGHSSLRFSKLPAGSMLEVCPTSFKVARKVGELLAKGKSGEEAPSLGGCGLIIDYGANHAFGNSLRAFRNHKIVDVFHEPGNSDLTANVDFAYLKEAMGDLVTTHGPMLQGDFLKNMGLPFRLQGLLKAAKSEERREDLRGAAARLVDPVGMGKEYQVLGITGESPSADGAEVAPVWPFMAETPPAT